MVFDIGSYWGSYALPSLAAGATVYAFEPDTEANKILLALAQANDLDARLHIRPEAVAEPGGYPPEFIAAAEDSDVFGQFPGRDFSPAFTTIDRAAKEENLDQLDWVKIDVEGGELSVLRGSADVIRQFRPRFLIEDHTDPYPWVAKLGIHDSMLSIFRDAGYDVTIIPYPGPGPARTYLSASHRG